MSTTSFRTFSKGIVLEGAAADPSDNIEGSLFNNSSSTKIKAYIQAAVRELITADQTQTLTNKTIDADSNTISNIDNADIKAGAAIDATKIADGSVTSTEFQYIGGLTSDAQTQINSKISASSTDTLTNKTIDGDNNTVQDLALTSLKTNLTDASKFLVRDASGIVVSNTKAVPAGDVIGTTDSQTLTNKVLSGNTAATLISGSGTLTLNTTGTVTVPNATDTLVGKATTDILTNKTLQSDLIDNYLDFNQETAPASPSAGTLRFYVKSDDKLYKKTSAGVETEVGSASAGFATKVGCRYSSTSGQSIANGGTATTLIMATSSFDTASAMNTSTGEYTVSEAGLYLVSSQIKYAGANFTVGGNLSLYIYNNGSQYGYMGFRKVEVSQFNSFAITGYDIIVCALNEVITIRAQHDETTGRSLDTTAGYNHISIVKISA